MPLNRLYLAISQGTMGQPFSSPVCNMTTGRLYLLDGNGFTLTNGVLSTPRLQSLTGIIREFGPGVGEYLDTEFSILVPGSIHLVSY